MAKDKGHGRLLSIRISDHLLDRIKRFQGARSLSESGKEMTLSDAARLMLEHSSWMDDSLLARYIACIESPEETIKLIRSRALSSAPIASASDAEWLFLLWAVRTAYEQTLRWVDTSHLDHIHTILGLLIKTAGVSGSAEIKTYCRNSAEFAANSRTETPFTSPEIANKLCKDVITLANLVAEFGNPGVLGEIVKPHIANLLPMAVVGFSIQMADETFLQRPRIISEQSSLKKKGGFGVAIDAILGAKPISFYVRFFGAQAGIHVGFVLTMGGYREIQAVCWEYLNARTPNSRFVRNPAYYAYYEENTEDGENALVVRLGDAAICIEKTNIDELLKVMSNVLSEDVVKQAWAYESATSGDI